MTQPTIEVTYELEGQSHQAHTAPFDLGPTATMFYFFEPHTAEVLVRVLDGHAINGHWWVAVAVLSDLPVHIKVTLASGAVWSCESNALTARMDTEALR